MNILKSYWWVIVLAVFIYILGYIVVYTINAIEDRRRNDLLNKYYEDDDENYHDDYDERRPDRIAISVMWPIIAPFSIVARLISFIFGKIATKIDTIIKRKD